MPAPVLPLIKKIVTSLVLNHITNFQETRMTTVISTPMLELIKSRRSVRGFLPDPIDNCVVEAILDAARSAPSGSNIQPWCVHVVQGRTRNLLADALCQAHNEGLPEQREYDYYPTQWRSPYLERRRENGWGLYSALGITKADKQAMHAQRGRNFDFFGAPVVMMFAIDNDLQYGSWLDYGMFLQNVMLAARAVGLHTCPQAAVANYPNIVKPLLQMPENQTLMCGIALGHEDPAEPANQFRATRQQVAEFTVFHS